ncbi:MAG TPA: class I SAM-dependent methyltransferase, partial [candidate division Zixibacteria bacterium]|nr:class I SAM-dependent methyltransferase [candidate division Zixibacteria bacterium]
MLDVLDALLSEKFLAIDLACGPGSLSQRLLARFPKAHCISVDLDPVLLAVGQGALGTMNGRRPWDYERAAPLGLWMGGALGTMDGRLRWVEA